MEGCPKQLMISFDLKEPVSTEDVFEKPLKKYIREFYHEDPNSYQSEINQITQLRKSISNIPHDKQGCAILHKYYIQLHYLQSRFPMREGGVASTTFIWYDVYNFEPVSYKDIKFEQACVLYSLASLYSQLGANENRSSDESLRSACTHFQTAAGAYQFLKENFSLGEFPDMSEDILTMKSNVMLGQALECILEKSIRDNRNALLIAKVSIQVVDYFNEAASLLDKPGTAEIGSSTRKNWIKHLKIKALSYHALAYTFMSNDAEEKEMFGAKVSYMQAALKKITEATKLLKKQPVQVIESVQFIADVVSQKYDAAKKDNDFVYHMIVPELSSMEEIKGVNLIKPIVFQYNDASVAGVDIFQKLVPMKAHELASIYSEAKDNHLRSITALIENKNIQLSQYMSAMNIEELLNPKGDCLPDELILKNQFLRNNPDLISKVEKDIEELTILTSTVESMLNDIKKMLENVVDDEGHKSEVVNLKDENDKCEVAHVQARKTNEELCKILEESKEKIIFLSGDSKIILQSMPSQDIVEAPSDEPVVQRIREILGKVEKMKDQRAYLLSKLREQLHKDDITTQLVVRGDENKQAFFEEQLQKHNETTDYIKQNLLAQDNIIQALTEANAKYATTREKVAIAKSKFDNQAKSYVGAIVLFLELKERIRAGLNFYCQLKMTVESLLQKVESFFNKQQKIKTETPARPTASKPNLLISKSNIRQDFAPKHPLDNPFFQNMSAQTFSPSSMSQQDPNLSLRHPPKGQEMPNHQLFSSNANSQYTPQINNFQFGTRYPGNIDDVNKTILRPGVDSRMPQNVIHSSPFLQHQQPQSPQLSQPKFPETAAQLPDMVLYSRLAAQQPSLNLTRQQTSMTPVMQVVSNSRGESTGSIREPPAHIRPNFVVQEPQPLFQPSSSFKIYSDQSASNQFSGSFQASPKLMDSRQISLDQQHIRMPFQTVSTSNFSSVLQPPSSVVPLNFNSPSQILQASSALHLNDNSMAGYQSNMYNLSPQSNSRHQLISQRNPEQPQIKNHFLSQQQQTPSQLHSQQPQMINQFNLQQDQTSSYFTPQQSASTHLPLGLQQPQYANQLESSLPHFSSQPNSQATHLTNQIGSQYHNIAPQQHQQLPSQNQIGLQHPQFKNQFILQRPQSPNQLVSQQSQNQPANCSHHNQNQQTLQQNNYTGQYSSQVPQYSNQVGPQQSPLSQLSLQQPLNQNGLQPSGMSNQLRSQLLNPSSLPQTQFTNQFEPQTQILNRPLTHQNKFQQNQKEKFPVQSHLQNLGLSADDLSNNLPPPLVPEMVRECALPNLLQPTQSEVPEHLQHNQYNQSFKSAKVNSRFNEPANLAGPNNDFLDNSGNTGHFYKNNQEPTPQAHQKQELFQSDSKPCFHFVKDVQSHSSYEQPSHTTSLRIAPLQEELQKPFKSQTLPQQYFHYQPTQNHPLQSEKSMFVSTFQQINHSTISIAPTPLPLSLANSTAYYPSARQTSQNGLPVFYPVPAIPSQPGGVLYTAKPTMSLSTDPVVSNILGKNLSANDLSQLGFQQFQLQQVVLQQQQLIAMVQSQQNILHNEEKSKIETLQGQILEQQKLIESFLKQKNSEEKLDSNIKSKQPEFEKIILEQQNFIMKMLDEKNEKSKSQNNVPTQKNNVPTQQNNFLTQQHSVVDKYNFENNNFDIRKSNKEISDNSAVIVSSENQIKMLSIPSTGAAIIESEKLDVSKLTIENPANSNRSLKQNPPDYPSISQNTNVLTKSFVNEDISGQSIITSSSNLSSLILKTTTASTKPFYEPKTDAKCEKSSECPVTVSLQSENQRLLISLEKKIDVSDTSSILEEHIFPDQFLQKSLKQGIDQQKIVVNGDVNGDLSSTDSDKLILCKTISSTTDINQITNMKRDDETTNIPTNDLKDGKSVQENPTQNISLETLPFIQLDKIESLSGQKVIQLENNNDTQLDNIDDTDGTLLDVVDLRPELGRQIGHESFYGGESDESLWQAYINDLGNSVNKLQAKCRTFCEPLLCSKNLDGFGSIWRDLEKVEDLDICNYTTQAGDLNITKNRYRDILPWDHSRVHLETVPNDYINASFIESLTPLSPRYVATQAPIPQTFEDFWIMVWEQNASVIVMLTNEVESQKLKCHPYWNRNCDEPAEYGNMVVILMDENVSASWKIRTFTILNKKTENTRVVKHLQFTSWPDYGTPESPNDLLIFMEEVHRYHLFYDPSTVYPLVLHCSAGVGRTGTFCCLYSAIHEIRGQNGLIEIPGVIRKLRQYRPHMVQRKEQMIFCYHAVLQFAQQFVASERENLFKSASNESPNEDPFFSSGTSQSLKGIASDYKSAFFSDSCNTSSVPQDNFIKNDKEVEYLKNDKEVEYLKDTSCYEPSLKTLDIDESDREDTGIDLSKDNLVIENEVDENNGNDMGKKIEMASSTKKDIVEADTSLNAPKFKINSDIFSPRNPSFDVQISSTGDNQGENVSEKDLRTNHLDVSSDES